MFKFLIALAVFTQLHLAGVNEANCNQWERTYNATWVSQSADVQLVTGKWTHLRNVEVPISDDSFYVMLEYFCRDEPTVLCDAHPCTGDGGTD